MDNNQVQVASQSGSVREERRRRSAILRQRLPGLMSGLHDSVRAARLALDDMVDALRTHPVYSLVLTARHNARDNSTVISSAARDNTTMVVTNIPRASLQTPIDQASLEIERGLRQADRTAAWAAHRRDFTIDQASYETGLRQVDRTAAWAAHRRDFTKTRNRWALVEKAQRVSQIMALPNTTIEKMKLEKRKQRDELEEYEKAIFCGNNKDEQCSILSREDDVIVSGIDKTKTPSASKYPIDNVLNRNEFNAEFGENDVESNRCEKESSKNENDCVPTHCSICLELFDPDLLLKQLPCKHVFHVACLSDWLRNHKSCPLCRLQVIH